MLKIKPKLLLMKYRSIIVTNPYNYDILYLWNGQNQTGMIGKVNIRTNFEESVYLFI